MKRCPICARSFPEDERFCSEHGLPLVEERLAVGDNAGDLSGHVLDHRYRLAGVAGKGGMGVVYEAENLRIGRRCAVKVLHAQMLNDEKMRMRLFREVQATSRIRHPNVVEILDYGHDEIAGSYLVMEYLGGRSLGQLLRNNQPLPLPFVCKLGVQLASALSACHAHGLIHRDLKPSNARLLPDGAVKVLDFGLVKPFEPKSREEFVTISTGGIAFGTPWYMSPEQASFKPLDPRSDIYSLGVMLYEFFVGRPPFLATTPLEVIDAQLNKPVPLPGALDPPVTLPARVEFLLLKALNKDPGDRHQSMAELMDDLYQIAHDEGVDMADLSAQPLKEPSSTRPESDDVITPMVTLPSAALRDAQPTANRTDRMPENQPLTVPVMATPADVETLIRLANERKRGLGERIGVTLREMIPRYRNLDGESLDRAITAIFLTAIRYLGEQPPEKLPDSLYALADERTKQRFTLAELVGALWMGYSSAHPLLQQAAENDIERYAALQDFVDRRIFPLVFQLVDRYVNQQHHRLLALTETLTHRNEELELLRKTLSERVRVAAGRLAEAEQLKARVADSISSGLMLIERSSHRILMFNKAMERISGLNASQVLDRQMDDVVHFVEGVPMAEFIEQIRMHGEVGLRKLRIKLAGGEGRAVYVRGQAFRNARGENKGTLFIVDDVTEREQIIETFSRYVSREVVDRVLSQGHALQPGGEAKEAVLLAVNICNFRDLVQKSSPEQLVEILSDYVRSVADAVFHHGGSIDTVVADGILVYFADLSETSTPAIRAAMELIGRIEAINDRREREEKPVIHVGVGVHVGDVLMLNVGGKRRMVHTVVGEAAQIALALRDVAASGEVLVTEAIKAGASDEIVFVSGPVIQVPSQDEALTVYRAVFQPEAIGPPETLH